MGYKRRRDDSRSPSASQTRPQFRSRRRRQEPSLGAMRIAIRSIRLAARTMDHCMRRGGGREAGRSRSRPRSRRTGSHDDLRGTRPGTRTGACRRRNCPDREGTRPTRPSRPSRGGVDKERAWLKSELQAPKRGRSRSTFLGRRMALNPGRNSGNTH